MSQWNFNFLTPKYLEMPWYQEETWVNEVLRKETEHITGVRNVNAGSELKKIPIGNCAQEKMLMRLLESGNPFIFNKARACGVSKIVKEFQDRQKCEKKKKRLV